MLFCIKDSEMYVLTFVSEKKKDKNNLSLTAQADEGVGCVVTVSTKHIRKPYTFWLHGDYTGKL